MEVFPGAKVILTTRSPNTWYDSCINSVYLTQELCDTLAGKIFMSLTPKGRQILTTNRVCNHPTNGHDEGRTYNMDDNKKA